LHRHRHPAAVGERGEDALGRSDGVEVDAIETPLIPS
jgi:hypothetical protein